MKRLLIFTVLLIVPLLGGCLSKRGKFRESFALVTPPLANNVRTNGPMMACERVSVAPPFDTPSLTYRTGEFSYERDPYASFLDSPAACFGEPIRVCLQNAGFFHAVVGQESTLKAGWKLETTIQQLYGDFRDRTHPSAVLGLRFMVIEKSERGSNVIVLQKTYIRRIPLKGRTAAAVIAGWDEASQEIIKELMGDLKTNVERQGSVQAQTSLK
jgi:ABC-type uncharacterized transport system auxiliary subunit